MTDTTALDELIKAVEAGDEWVSVKADAAFDDKGNAVMACRAYGADGHPERAGSLDAAKALHDALLPGCSQYSIVSDPTCLCVKVAWWPNGLSGQVCYQGEGWDEGNPARAWLLAVLRAYRAQIGGAA